MQKKITHLLLQLSWVRIIFFMIIIAIGLNKLPWKTAYLEKEFMYKTVAYGDLLFAIDSRLDPVLFKKTYPSAGKFRVIWITDSSIRFVDTVNGSYTEIGQIPISILHNTPQVQGKELEIVLYHLGGTTIMEKYFATIHALQQNPDAIFVNLNPTSDFMKFASVSIPHAASSSLYHSSQKEHIKNSLLFSQPADIFWMTLCNLDIFLKNTIFSIKLRGKIFLKIDFLKKNGYQANNPVPFTTYPFFRRYIQIVEPPYSQAENNDIRHILTIFQLNLLSVLSFEKNDISVYFYEELLKTLSRAKIPAYVYMDPVNLELINSHSELKQKYDGLLDMAEKIARQWRSPLLTIEIFETKNLSSALVFYDTIHLYKEEYFTEYLKNKIIALSQLSKE